ncbi:MAG TPA: hypothetical protein P5262_04525 [Candidatus Moranbacteria bacterium]|nr:hypothetical protein [Candidatus Moranbacteria bacterium]
MFRKDETGAVVFDLPESDFGCDKNGELKKQTVLRDVILFNLKCKGGFSSLTKSLFWCTMESPYST